MSSTTSQSATVTEENGAASYAAVATPARTSLYRERLRVDGYLTNCETGDRIVIVKKLENPLPTSMTIGGKYRAMIRHRGQPNENAHCSNCLQAGHVARDCINDKVCRHCKSPGHIQSNCPSLLKDDNSADESSDDESDSEDDDEQIDDGNETKSESQTETHKPPIATDTTNVPSTDITPVPSSGSTNVPSSAAESTDSKDEPRKRKKSKKSKGKKQESKQPQNQTIIDSFLKETPSRKSSQLPSDVRSPLDELNNTPKKKCNAK
ncbi:zinc finger CCHC domain-containing protein 10-like [Argopecten irradians]|uniref:zinc finger CCHC domain-containing protein 10-like n=2 Tax=Argopecten irradians TaxID=31199 RepID=UPI00370FFDC0